jgi:peptidoglycan/xylan/chitin deacetylase (PgdA/CDA1 family)
MHALLRAGRGARRHPVALLTALLALAVLTTVGAWVLVAAHPSRLRPPLVASTERQRVTWATPTPGPYGDVEAPGSTVISGILGGPRRSHDDSLPGRLQGGAAPPAPSGRSVNVPILLYHYIRGNPRPHDRAGYRLSVTPEHFADQMALLRSAGAHTVSIGDVMAALAGGPPLPPRPVVLTFDDGHDDFAFRAVPVLQEDGFTATDFVVPGFLGRSSYLSVAQLQEVAAAGMTIGAHTMHHVDLAAVAPAVAEDEIMRSRSMLQQLTGQPVLDFAYPFGIFTRSVEAMVERAGFRDAASTEPGVRQFASQPFILRRIEVTGDDGLTSFAAKAGVPAPPPGWPARPASPSPSSASRPAPAPASPSARPVTSPNAPAGPPGSEVRPSATGRSPVTSSQAPGRTVSPRAVTRPGSATSP